MYAIYVRNANGAYALSYPTFGKSSKVYNARKKANGHLRYKCGWCATGQVFDRLHKTCARCGAVVVAYLSGFPRAFLDAPAWHPGSFPEGWSYEEACQTIDRRRSQDHLSGVRMESYAARTEAL